MGKHIVKLVALGIFSMPAKAEEKVFYCQTTGNAEVTTEGVVQYKVDTFKFKVTPDQVVFGSGGFFDGAKMKTDKFSSFNFFTAKSEWDMLGFNNGVFSYGQLMMGTGLSVMTARCDDF